MGFAMDLDQFRSAVEYLLWYGGDIASLNLTFDEIMRLDLDWFQEMHSRLAEERARK